MKITTKRTLCYARRLAKVRNLTGISFTWGWLRRFLKRHHLSLRKPSTSVTQPDEGISDVVENFVAEIGALLASGLYSEEFIFNLDETSVATEATRERTIETKGKKRVKVNSVGKEKECHTVLLGGTMSGKKLRALMIFKGKGVRQIKSNHRNVKVAYREENSWMDRKIMKSYIHEVIRYWAEDIPQNKRGLLLIDNFEAI